jgi:hypothetical protein
LTVKIPAIRAARSPGPASALSVRKAPRNASPKPTPATAVPDRKAAADITSMAAKVTATPASRTRHPASAAADPVGDPLLVWRAAERLRISAAATTDTETNGLLTLGEQVTFRDW